MIIHDGSRGYLQCVREHHTSEFRLYRCNDGFLRLSIYPFCRPRTLHGVSAPPGIPTEYACHLCRPNDDHTDNGKAVVDPFNPVSVTGVYLAAVVFTVFLPLLYDSILLTRLFALYPLSSTPLNTLLKIFAFLSVSSVLGW